MFPDVWLRGSTPKSKLEKNFNKCLFQNAMMMAHIVRLNFFFVVILYVRKIIIGVFAKGEEERNVKK